MCNTLIFAVVVAASTVGNIVFNTDEMAVEALGVRVGAAAAAPDCHATKSDLDREEFSSQCRVPSNVATETEVSVRPILKS
jgi:hypothetical protein